MIHGIDWPEPSLFHLLGGALLSVAAWCLSYPHDDKSYTAGGTDER